MTYTTDIAKQYLRKYVKDGDGGPDDDDPLYTPEQLKEIKQVLRPILAKRNETFLKIIELYEKMEQLEDDYAGKYSEDYLERLMDKYDFGGPFVYDELSPNFIEYVMDYGSTDALKSDFKKDIDAQVDEFVKEYIL